MATEAVIKSSITLKYEDKGSYTFDKLDYETATDEQLYELAEALNGFQTDPMVKLEKVTQKSIRPQL